MDRPDWQRQQHTARFSPESGETARLPPLREEVTRVPPAYKTLDRISEGFIYFLVVAGPWLFGSVDPWAVWIMNSGAYVLGMCLIGKWVVARRQNYKPTRWGDEETGETEGEEGRRTKRGGEIWTRCLAALTVLIPGYCLVSGLNARATFHVDEQRFEYYEHVSWLPHSYDRGSTFFTFWTFVALAAFFWSVRDWLMRRTSRDPKRRADSQRVPTRLKRLMWVLCLNGAALGIEAILQRLSGTTKVLWLIEPRWNNTPEVQYGPYPYRSNAAEYFNLLWPVCLGFWWLLQREFKSTPRKSSRVGGGPHLLLLPCTIIMAAAPIVSMSRGGAVVSGLLMALALPILTILDRKTTRGFRAGIVIVFGIVVASGWFLSGDVLRQRFRTIFTDRMSGRTEIYRNASQMAVDYPMLGIGPGAFAAIYQFYRSDPGDMWAGHLHDDWLEFRVTFGLLGMMLLLLALAGILSRPFWGPGLTVDWPYLALIFLALGGCLVHAKYDFPLQIDSINRLFVLLAALLSVLARKRVQ